ncbi:MULTISPECIES: DUF4180 domain-containing protein [Clostridium]|uniref:Uncharacterized protein n=1 Tax=Clostridium colicanis DSM 13634 TaxID=1121305 RepID=A0A151ANJ3_9CLOT|nr:MULTISPECIES: DUF4180 domain-containing protein [Clostridium]KYH29201.1 hypothetical protein CLCOL_13380 [Clostridium colicanis DSM 13634]
MYIEKISINGTEIAYESNKGRDIFFVSSVEEAIERLSRA